MPSRGRFQSRVFSQLSQRSLRLRDQVGRWVRHSQVAAVWSIQIVLYPLYAGFQALRTANRQFSQARPTTVPLLQAIQHAVSRLLGLDPEPPTLPSASDPILQTLALLQPWLEPDAGLQTVGVSARSVAIAPTSPPSADSQPTVQGIASCLESQRLLLVSADNRLLDGLTVPQQLRLRQGIAEALASYWRDRRRHALSQTPVLPLPLPPRSPSLILPVQWFYRLMAWEQQSQVAIAADLFRESTLALYFADLDCLDLGEVTDEPQEASQSGRLTPANKTNHSPSRPVPNDPYRALLAHFSTHFAPQNPEEQSLRWIPENLDPRSLAIDPAPPSPLSNQPSKPMGSLPQNLSVPQNLLIPQDLSVAQSQSLVPLSVSPSTAVQPYETPYIDTSAKLVGYTRHPLEQLLQWLDQGMVWLEDRWVSLWHWCQERMRP